MNSLPNFTLRDGASLPRLGFGTYHLNGAAGVESITSAIRVGYRLLDSAFNYENEGALGRSIRRAEIPREQLRVTSKLPGRHHAYAEALPAIEESLYRAQLDFYDLYLIHWPNPRQRLYVEAWQALIEAQKRGLLRSIGVCNFLPEHLETLARETGVWPVVNQVELHPYFPQEAQRAFDAAHGIVTEAWSPLARANQLLREPILQELATRLQKTVPQIILRWHVQLGVVPLPMASGERHQRENLSVFDFTLTEEDMSALGTLARPEGRTFDQDPARYEEF